MASIKKIKNKKGVSYKIIVSQGTDERGKQILHTKTFRPDDKLSPAKQKKAVEEFATDYERRIRNGYSFEGEKIAFAEFANKWLEDIKAKRTYGTYEDYKCILDNKIIPHFRGFKVADINTQHIERFYRSLNKDYSIASIKKQSHILKGIFKKAMRFDMINKNPCECAEISKKDNKEDTLKFFTPEQSLMFLKSLEMTYESEYNAHSRIDDTGKEYCVAKYMATHKLSLQHKVFFNIAIFCGLRRGEVLALKWKDIALDKKELYVTKTVSKNETGVIYKDPKTSKSKRTVPFAESLVPLLKEYRLYYKKLKVSLGDTWQGDDNLFVQADGKLMCISTPSQTFARHLRRFNSWIDSNEAKAKSEKLEKLPIISLHGLRHSCATLLNYLGMNIIDISSILGHAQTSTTMDIYTHSFETQKRVAADKIEEFLQEKCL